MKLARVWVVCAAIVLCSIVVVAQTAPNYENGWKPLGSYDGSHLDTVNLMNGNVMLHAPIIPDVPQRGGFNLGEILYTSSKDWQVVCVPRPTGPLMCSWKNGGSQLQVQTSIGMTVRRTLETIYLEGTPEAYSTFNYSLTTMDGATHQLTAVAASRDANGSFTKFDTFDLTGYHVEITTPDANGVGTTAIITDRRGTQYQGMFFGSAPGTSPVCRIPQTSNNLPHSSSGIAPMVDDSSGGAADCSQAAFASLATDSNGNQMILTPRAESSTARDTLGRVPQLFLSGPAYSSADSMGCGGAHPFYYSSVFYYIDPNGSTQPVKLCYSQLTVHTAFNQMAFGSIPVGEFDSSLVPSPYAGLTTVILADGTKWTFDYDNYGEVTYIGLPTGGSITYTWTTINFSSCDFTNPALVSRAVATRTLDDGQGHTEHWQYHWGTATSAGLTNIVTDPLQNDTVHIFTAQIPPALGTGGACSLFETSTIAYQGLQGANHPLQRVDTTYTSALYTPSAGIGVIAGIGSVFATDVVTTIYPSGKVKKVHKDPDAGPGNGAPIFGNVKKELEYDWGQGAPGALLRETDTTYKWEINPAYVTAHLLDLPASAIVKDGSGNRVAETDYTYDEPNYLTTPSPAVTTQHTAPPYGVRGNQSTVSHWLNTSNSFISSHTNWYDTGEVYQKIDPLGHTTTYSYDPAYVGGYLTETCSPPTSSIAHCVSGTYDFNTGVLTSLTNENATTQASGNSQGDSAHTSNYTYDFMFRITSSLAPPDSANGGARAQNTFTFSPPNVFPLSMQQTKSITNALSDSATSFFDGLGRSYRTQHALPGNTATVDTTFDAAGHAAMISNPYFSTSDPTYGITTSRYDALDRVTQVTKQDGSISSVNYNVATSSAGNCTDTTDEANKQRRTCSDALDRLVEVDEPGVLAGQTTNNYVTLQTDGNFVLYDPNHLPLWSTGTSGTNAGPVEVQDDGNVVLYQFRWQAGTYRAPSSATFPYDPCRVGDSLFVGQTLTEGQCLESMSGMTFLLMSHSDIQIYDRQLGQVTFDTGTYGQVGGYAVMQSDGRLAIYSPSNTLLWASTTSGTGANVATLENDGRLIIYSTSWNAGTSQGQTPGSIAHPSCDIGFGVGTTGAMGVGSCAVSRNGRYELLMQSDGNLVLYNRSVSPMLALWSTNTGLTPLSPVVAMRTLYTYDALGNLTCVEQHGDAPTGTGCSASSTSDATSPWRVRRFTYDSLSRLLTAKNPESGMITYIYDSDGNLLQKTSPAPNQTGTATQTVSYCYDALHRVTGKGYGAQSCPLSAAVVGYGYDSGASAKGKLVSLFDQAGTANYAYDALGRLITETRMLFGAGNPAPGTDVATVTKTLRYEYNLNGSLKTLQYPSGAAVTYTPDSAGRILSAVDSGNNISYATGATYGPDGALTGFVSGYSSSFAGITNAFAYNKRLQPLTMSATAPSQTVYSIGYDFHYGGGNNGNVFGIYNYKDANRNQTFTYDSLNRLTSAQNAGTDCTAKILQNKSEYWGNNYVYDAWGNMIQKSITKCGAENLQVTADAHNWIHASGTDYQYDAAGNMTYDATASLSYTFDQENRLTGAGGYGYIYDADGNRVEKVTPAANPTSGTLYWYMTPGIVAESDLAGSTKSEYVFFGGGKVARKDFPSNAVSYYFSDRLKTAAVITDATGNIKAESDYYPWGGELQFSNNDSNHYKFTGKERDSETGLDYFGARYYGNAFARFTTVDPLWVKVDRLIDPQRLNLYGYGRNNPLKFTDPTGMDVTLGTCKGGDAQKCFDKTTSGLRKEDRSHVHLVAGDGKNGFKKGQYGITVDADYHSKSGNFQALQKLANDHSATVQIDVLGAKVTISGTIVVKDSSGNLTNKPLKEALGMDFFLETPWNGQTLFKNWGGPLVENMWYTNGNNTEVEVLADTSEEIIVETIHHELRHVLLGDFGRAAAKGAHDAPGVNAATRAAEDEARQNRKEK